MTLRFASSRRAPLALATILAIACALLLLLLLTAAPALAADQTLKVKVAGPGSVSANEGTISGCTESGGASCEGEYTEASTITLTATPTNEQTMFSTWTACTRESASTCEVEIGASPIEVKAEFTAITQQKLTVATTEGTGAGTVTGSQPGGEFTAINCIHGAETCAAEYNQGATITLTATRATHSKFTGWEGCTNVISTNEFTPSECEVQMTEAKTVKAKFAAIPQAELKLEVEGPGEVTSSPSGFDCTLATGPCHAEFDTEGPESTVTLTAAHNERTSFTGWSTIEGSPGTCTGAASPCEVAITAAVKLKAKFTPITQETLTVTTEGIGTVTGTSPGGEFTAIECGNGPTTCEATYNQATTITLTATPPAHSHFLGFTGCESVTGLECTVTMSTARQVTPTFVNTFSLTVARTGLGSISASEPPISRCSPTGGTCAGEYDEGARITLIATPAAHKHVKWEAGDCKAEPTATECEVEIGTSPAEVNATFPPNTQTLTLTSVGQGSIRANSGAISSCTEGGGTCAGNYIEAATVTLIASPRPGQAVAWQGCTALPNPNTCEVEIGASETAVRATFVQITHALTIAKAGSGQGQVACNGAPCATTYPEGTALTLTATPASRSTFAGWSGGGCSGTGACQLTLAADAQVTATFNANPIPSTEESCVVPRLAGETLDQARAALIGVHCSLGKVTKPKKKKGTLVVRSSSPAAGASLPAGGPVSLKLSLKPKKKMH